MTGSVGYMLLMTENQHYLNAATFIITIIQLASYFVFIPEHGVVAAATITTLAIALRNIISVYIAYRKLSVISLPIPIRYFDNAK